MLRKFLCFWFVAIAIAAQLGDFDLLPGYVLRPDSAYLVRVVSSSCRCKQLCSENSRCIAFSCQPFGDGWRCWMFDISSHLSIQPSSAGLVGVAIVQGALLEKDLMYYFIPAENAASFDDAMNICSKTKGFRLARIKTVASKEIAFQYAGGSPFMAIDLRKNPDNSPYYSDGTLFNNTELGKRMPNIIIINNKASYNIFVVFSSYFQDEEPEQKLRPLCQANFLNVTEK